MHHAATAKLSHLFADAECFRDIEQHIAELATPQERGEAFEVFAEGYLRTQRASQIGEVWPAGSIPITLREKYLLPHPEKGADGLVELSNGEHHAYQVKLRTDRSALTWAELATFVGIAEKTQGRFVFTNSQRVASQVSDRGVYFIRGSDLDELGPAELREIADCIAGQPAEHTVKNPRPHQQEAVRSLLSRTPGV